MSPESEILHSENDNRKVLSLAKAWLEKQGVDVNTILEHKEKEAEGELYISEPTEGKSFELLNILKSQVLNANDEEALQESIAKLLKQKNINFEKEFIISKKSRVDFKINNILIECKAGSFNKRGLLRQVKRYREEYKEVEAIIIVTPSMMRHFSIKNTPIYIINTTNSSLMVEGLS